MLLPPGRAWRGCPAAQALHLCVAHPAVKLPGTRHEGGREIGIGGPAGAGDGGSGSGRGYRCRPGGGRGCPASCVLASAHECHAHHQDANHPGDAFRHVAVPLGFQWSAEFKALRAAGALSAYFRSLGSIHAVRKANPVEDARIVAALGRTRPAKVAPAWRMRHARSASKSPDFGSFLRPAVVPYRNAGAASAFSHCHGSTS